MKSPSEHQIQSAFISWARQHPEANRVYAIPNAAKRSPRLAVYMLAEGLRKGVLDLHLPVPRGGCHGLWIEMKAGKNTLTDEQRAEAHKLAEDGYAVAACWDTETAITWTTAYLSGQIEPGFTELKPESSRSKRPSRQVASRST